MIIVLLMLTSALAGCTGTDTTDLEQQIADLQQSNDEMNETINQQNQDNLELRTLLEGLQLSLDDLDMELQQSNDEMNETINQQRQDLMDEINWVNNTADWAYMNLSNAYLSDTNLNNANLSNANLRYAGLSNADLTNADLSWADMRGADLSNADLTGANLYHVNAINLQECPAYLPTNWQCVNNILVGPFAYLNYVFLINANLTGANLTGANLTGANLIDVILTGANLTGVNLNYADLTGADLTDVYWFSTTCPDGTNSDDNGNTCENNL